MNHSPRRYNRSIREMAMKNISGAKLHPLGAVAPKIGLVEWTTEEIERAIDRCSVCSTSGVRQDGWVDGSRRLQLLPHSCSLLDCHHTRARSHSSTPPPCGMWTCWHHGLTQHTKEGCLLRRYQLPNGTKASSRCIER
jgi:hypothetical protein